MLAGSEASPSAPGGQLRAALDSTPPHPLDTILARPSPLQALRACRPQDLPGGSSSSKQAGEPNAKAGSRTRNVPWHAPGVRAMSRELTPAGAKGVPQTMWDGGAF